MLLAGAIPVSGQLVGRRGCCVAQFRFADGATVEQRFGVRPRAPQRVHSQAQIEQRR